MEDLFNLSPLKLISQTLIPRSSGLQLLNHKLIAKVHFIPKLTHVFLLWHSQLPSFTSIYIVNYIFGPVMLCQINILTNAYKYTYKIHKIFTNYKDYWCFTQNKDNIVPHKFKVMFSFPFDKSKIFFLCAQFYPSWWKFVWIKSYFHSVS